jgi:hypothetical protein
VKLGHVALDGTKVQANTSVHKAMSYAHMREAEKRLAAEVSAWFTRAEAIDAAEDREHGERRGDEMPDWVANKVPRLERIRAAKAALEAEAKAPPPDPDDDGPGPSSGMMERTNRPQRAADGGLPDRAQRNVTDPDSRIRPTKRGVIAGYNAQIAVDAAHQIIISQRVQTSPVDATASSRCSARRAPRLQPTRKRCPPTPASALPTISLIWSAAGSMPSWPRDGLDMASRVVAANDGAADRASPP